jgi:hypothetical protein
MNDQKIQCRFPDCDVVFSYKCNEVRHARTQHLEQHWPCMICGVSMLSVYKWRTHFKRCLGIRARSRPFMADEFDELLADCDRKAPVGHLAGTIARKEIDSCLAFLNTVPASPEEAAIRQPMSPVALGPTRRTLQFILGLMKYYPVLPTPPARRSMLVPLSLRWLVRLDVVQKIHAVLKFRRVRNGRVHGIFLMVSKILLWLAATTERYRGRAVARYDARDFQSWNYVFQVF